jgi:DNA-directed RNA polymerase specialized sigma24 family protein
MSAEAIGDCFGLSANAVYAQLKRTRDGLRAYLEENGIEV